MAEQYNEKLIFENLVILQDWGQRKFDELKIAHRSLDTKVSFLIAGYSAVIVALVTGLKQAEGWVPIAIACLVFGVTLFGISKSLSTLMQRDFVNLAELTVMADRHSEKPKVAMVGQIIYSLDAGIRYASRQVIDKTERFQCAAKALMADFILVAIFFGYIIFYDLLFC
jgi:hypothetical protein